MSVCLCLCLSSGWDGPHTTGPPFLHYFSPLFTCVLFDEEKRHRKWHRALILMFLPVFSMCLVKMGQDNIKFSMEVLFLSPVSLRHLGVKWKDEPKGEDVLLFWPKRGSSWAHSASAVPPRDCVYVYTSLCVGPLADCAVVSQGKTGSGLLVLSFSFSGGNLFFL